MRLLLFALVLPMLAGAAEVLTDAAYQRDVRPLLDRYCLACHSAAKHTGDIDLEQFRSIAAITRQPRVWQKVSAQLTAGAMPPKPLPQPNAEERTRLLAWTKTVLATAAAAHAGDPGPVVLRRLNNAEYTYTIRDLTGVGTLDPAREFPADGAAGEGFLNTGNALSMSPSLITKYLDAGKGIAAHAMLLPTGIRFSRSTSPSDWTNQLLAEIRAFYGSFTEAGGADTVTQQGIALDKNRGGLLPLKRYLTASLALRNKTATAEAVARKQGLSPKYLALLVRFLESGKPSPLADPLRARWRKASSSADIDAMVAGIARWQDTLWKFSSVGHIGKEDGPKAWMEPVDPVQDQQEFRSKLAPAAGNEIDVYLAAYDAGDGNANDIAVWRNPRIVIPGRDPVPLRQLPALAAQLSERRTRIFAATEASLNETGGDAAWRSFLGLGAPSNFRLDLMTSKMEKTGAYDFVQGWGTPQLPMVLANSSQQHVRVPGNMKPRGVAVHPSRTVKAAIGWRSPIAGGIQVEGVITRAHAECGSGVTYAVELRRGHARQPLATGEARNAQPVRFQSARFRVQPGDLVSLLVGPRDGNQSCALADVDFQLRGDNAQWSLAQDVAGNVLAGNPHADSNGRPVWHFYSEPVVGLSGDTVIPAGSLLARWQAAESAAERASLAAQLQVLLSGAAPRAEDKSPDAALFRQLNSLAGPLFAGITTSGTAVASSPWGLAANAFGKCPNGTPVDANDVCVQAPGMLSVRLPADLVANAEFVVTGSLEPRSGAEGTAQFSVTTAKPAAGTAGLMTTGTTIGTTNGQWSSNNQTVSYAMPVVVNPSSAARKRVETNFDEFRQMFPAALCYTKIVPVDEVVTLTLYHREDAHLARLILDDKQAAQLDRLWDELHYVSRDAIRLVDAFEQLWQYATQDADPSKFEPLRKPILARAAAFRQRLLESEPSHIEAVIGLADKAYRRPLTPAEKDQLRALYQKLRAQEMPHEEAIRLMLARVLVAPAFLYRSEKVAAGRQSAPVADYELASRLSYFLWSSMPDVELRAAAAAGRLRTPAGIQEQAHRMLRDSRVRRLAVEFGAAWLHIYGFDSLDEKSERHFPEFRDLRAAMYEEPIRFFADFFSANRSILHLLDANHTFLNEALARHYGIPNVKGDWQRVDGIRQYGRGGILGQGAVLAKQSGASRTSPILRGAWITEVLLGQPSPRPPKDVPPLVADEDTAALTVRELTERHTSDARCAGCHARIDPYGFPLERYDAIGRRRDHDLGNRPINDRSRLPDGAAADGLEGIRNYLLTTGRDAFVHQLCRKLLGYSLGRAVQLSDEPLLNEMQAQLAATGYPVSTAIDMIVTSRQFREIRGRDHEDDEQ